MAQQTPYFGLCFFDINDNLGSLSNVQAEMNRFVIIDRQLYGLYSIFGSGVINGWVVSAPEFQDPNSISVVVSSGIGIIQLLATETLFEKSVSNLPANQVLYLFAQSSGLTPVNRSADFFVTRSPSASQAVLLATIVTGDAGIVSIDNNVRREIGFQAVIEEEIKLHRHRGTPSKIDLATETRGQLPGSKIGDQSADIVTQGKFTQDRMPLLSHGSLSDIGLFGHAELDAMARKIEAGEAVDGGSSGQRLSEVMLANMLKEIIYLKLRFEDVDQDFLNELAYIPGVSPESFVDVVATTATVNNESGCVAGKVVEGGQIINVLWNTADGFEAGKRTNVSIGNDGFTITRADIETSLVEGFESGAISGEFASFDVTVEAVNSVSGVYRDGAVKAGDDFSGKFKIDQSNRAVFTRPFGGPQDWSAWDRLSLFVRCTTPTHGAVYMYLEGGGDFNGQGVQYYEKSSVYQLLAANELTTNPNPDLAGFVERTMVISTFAMRDKVTKLVIFADDIDTDFEFWVDEIRLRRSQSYMSQGTLRLRYGAAEEVVFNSLSFNATQPDGTSVRSRIRVADSEDGLASALFSPFMGNDESFVLRGKWAEVEILLYADSLQSVAPIVSSVELSLTADAEDNGFTIATAPDWARGKSSNVFFDSQGVGSIASPVTVGNIISLTNGQVSEISGEKVPVFGIGGEQLPPSEIQAYKASVLGNVEYGLTNAMSVVRTDDRRYIVCDTDNHRVAIFDNEANLISLYAGMETDTIPDVVDVIPLTATYNETTGILWLGFSKMISLTVAAFARISVTVGGKSFTLNEEGQIAATTVSARVIGVTLTASHQAILRGTEDIASVSYTAGFSEIFNPLYLDKPIRMYFAPISYHRYIYHPVYACESPRGKIWLCNATNLPLINNGNGVMVLPPIPSDQRHLYEFDPLVDTNRFSNSVYFMKSFGGSVKELNDGTIYVAGSDRNRKGFVYANPFNGNPRTVYAAAVGGYPTMVDIDEDGMLWVAESSTTNGAGRILKMDTKGHLAATIEGTLTLVNSIQVLANGNLLVGT